MKDTHFECTTGRELIRISLDLWKDFQDFFNVFISPESQNPKTSYFISYRNQQLSRIALSQDNPLNDFLHLQTEVLRLIIEETEERQDDHEFLITLTKSRSEFRLIEMILMGSSEEIANEYLAFIKNQIIPIYNIKIGAYENVLKIKHHKSFVRKKIEEPAEITVLRNHVPDEELKAIDKYICRVISDEKQRAHFEREIFGGRVNEIVYLVDNTDTKEFCQFFKFLKGQGYLTSEKKAIARWINRKFSLPQKSIGTIQTLEKYLNGKHDRMFLKKLIF